MRILSECLKYSLIFFNKLALGLMPNAAISARDIGAILLMGGEDIVFPSTSYSSLSDTKSIRRKIICY